MVSDEWERRYEAERRAMDRLGDEGLRDELERMSQEALRDAKARVAQIEQARRLLASVLGAHAVAPGVVNLHRYVHEHDRELGLDAAGWRERCAERGAKLLAWDAQNWPAGVPDEPGARCLRPVYSETEDVDGERVLLGACFSPKPCGVHGALDPA